MPPVIPSVFRRLLPAIPRESATEQARAALGGAVGLLLCAMVVSLAPHPGGLNLFLIAPLGATAVLVFAVPNSPLAQPWSAIVGNMVSAVTALAVLQVAPGFWAPGLAVGGAILVMMLARALHPPGGAIALLTALDPGPALEAGLWYALVPVGLSTAILVGAGALFNRATGRVYPFRLAPPAPVELADTPRLGLSAGELTDLLQRFHQSANMGVADLGRILATAEREAAQHRFDGTTCGDIASRKLITVTPETPLPRIAKLFRDHPIKSLPVIGEAGQLLGLVLQADLIRGLAPGGVTGLVRNGSRSVRLTAKDIMRGSEGAVAHDLPVGVLLNRMARQGVQVAPILREGKLTGILTRSDIMALLLRDTQDRRKSA